jgi:hypothetical protein
VSQPFTALRPFPPFPRGARDSFDLLGRAPSRFPGAVREITAWPVPARCVVALSSVAAPFPLLRESTLRGSSAIVVASWAPPVFVATGATPILVAAWASTVVIAARASLEAAPFLARRPFRRWRGSHDRRHGAFRFAPLPIQQGERCRRDLNGIEALEQRLQHRHPGRVPARRDIAADLVAQGLMR